MFVCCLKSQQHASLSLGRPCSDCTCCHTEKEVATLSISLGLGTLTPGHPVPSPTLHRQTSGRETSDHFSTSCDHFSTSCDHFSTSCDHFSTNCDHFSTSCDHFSTSCDHFSTSCEVTSTSCEVTSTSCEVTSTNPPTERSTATAGI